MAPEPEKSAYAMIPMQTALETIAKTLTPLPPVDISTAEALNHILADSIHAPHPHPPFRASIKDGYAVTLPLPSPAVLNLVSSSVAGATSTAEISAGQAVYVTTGAPVPDAAHAVVMVEQCIRENDSVTILPNASPKMGQEIRPIGSDLKEGELVLEPGTLLRAAEIGLLATCGIHTVKVHARPVIGVLSTGDELLDVSNLAEALAENGGHLPFGKIIDSNRPMLLAAVQESLPFCEARDLGIVLDEKDTVTEAMQNAVSQCNIVLTSGGVSMGNRDLIKPVLESIATVHFGRVIMKPGKPLTYATVSENACFLGLPGNPVSCFVCFHLAVAVAGRRLAGWGETEALGKRVEAVITHDIRLDPQRPEYHRATLEVRPTFLSHLSHMIRSKFESESLTSLF